MILPTPITKIDTIDDLFDSDMRILSRHDSALYTYLELIGSPFVNRFDTYKDVISKEVTFDGLRTGSLAYIYHKYILIFQALELNAMFNILNDEEFMDSLHISKDDGGSEPFFIVVTGDLDKDIIGDFNIM